MSNNERVPSVCETVNDEMLSLVYGELADGRRTVVEAHLAGCSGCREVYDGYRQSMSFLDTWPEIEEPLDVRTLAHDNRRSWMVRAKPVLSGVAAAVAFFVLLTAAGGTAEYRDGRLVLSLGAPATPTPTPAPTLDPQEQTEAMKRWVRAVLREELDRGMSLVVEAVHQDLNARDNVQERHRRLLARATDLRREADRRDYEMALRSLAREVAEETNLMSGDINAVIQMVAGRGRTPADVQ